MQQLIYQRAITEGIPRLLSLLDRDQFSPTYGCFDRQYWHYRIVTDFPSAVYQQGVLALAVLYTHKLDNRNIYYKNGKILDYICAGMEFWTGIQNRDGSFDEWFPNEHSYVATAFTAYAVSEALLIVGDDIPTDINSIITDKLRRAGEWLTKHADTTVANHTAGAIAALYNIYLLTHEERFLQATRRNIKILSASQSSEGWFCEYGGADAGYLSVSIDYLAKYYKRSNDALILPIIEKALDFTVYFIHPDGTYGGTYGSRNTSYLIPHGLEILSDMNPVAGSILNIFYRRLVERDVTNLSTVDDRYFVFFFIGNYIQAALEHILHPPKLDIQQESASGSKYDPFGSSGCVKVFRESGIFVKKTSDYHIVGNFKKNGTLNIYTDQSLIYSDSGYFGLFKKHTLISSQWFDRKKKLVLVKGENDTNADLEIDLRGSFLYPASPRLSTKLLILLRMFSYSFGRSEFIAGLLHRLITWVGITKTRKAPVDLRRKIHIGKDRIEIEDELYKNTRVPCRVFKRAKESTVIHSPTSKYFQPEEIIDTNENPDLSDMLNKTGNICVRYTFEFNKDKIEIRQKYGDVQRQRSIKRNMSNVYDILPEPDAQEEVS